MIWLVMVSWSVVFINQRVGWINACCNTYLRWRCDPCARNHTSQGCLGVFGPLNSAVYGFLEVRRRGHINWEESASSIGNLVHDSLVIGEVEQRDIGASLSQLLGCSSSKAGSPRAPRSVPT